MRAHAPSCALAWPPLCRAADAADGEVAARRGALVVAATGDALLACELAAALEAVAQVVHAEHGRRQRLLLKTLLFLQAPPLPSQLPNSRTSKSKRLRRLHQELEPKRA